LTEIPSGRSTLENELVGDLDTEFSNQLPEKSEELSLDDLCNRLQAIHNGKLGKNAASLVAKMLSSKFPGELDNLRVRSHLQSKWGLLPGHQDPALMVALTKQPAARMLSSEAAENFLNDVAMMYLQQEGIPLPQMRAGGQSASQLMAIDPEALLTLKQQQAAVARDITEALSRYLEIGTSEQSNHETTLENDETTATNELNLWLSEHGEDYAEGIRPMFSAKKARNYDSFWNWNSQDIVLLSENILQGAAVDTAAAAEIEELIHCIVNRACDRSLSQISYLQETQELRPTMNHLYELCLRSQSVNPLFVDRSIDLAPITMIDAKGSIKFSEVPRLAKHKSFPCGRPLLRELRFPVQVFGKGKLTHSEELTQAFFDDLNIARHMGFSFQGKNVLITGAGRNSIGINILKNLLSGGARVLLTTSSYRPETTQMYQGIYARYGARGSVLRVLPFNQGSYQDVQALARYIEEDSGWDLDFIVPFAAVSEIGRELDDIDSKSELAHRLMLTNLLRLLGAVARGKREKQAISRPAQVILPLSPNHGLMGNDGLYSESKLALETLFSKWTSETWHDYLSLCGVNIGWTRGTGLMNDNDIVSQGVEALGVHTFSSTQMAAYIVCLMGGKMRTACQTVPLMADFGGGLGAVEDFKQHVGKIRRDLHAQSDIQRAIHHEDALQDAVVNKRLASPSPKPLTRGPTSVYLSQNSQTMTTFYHRSLIIWAEWST
jgi:fatty acid synthase subunit alpha, fungi type